MKKIRSWLKEGRRWTGRFQLKLQKLNKGYKINIPYLKIREEKNREEREPTGYQHSDSVERRSDHHVASCSRRRASAPADSKSQPEHEIKIN